MTNDDDQFLREVCLRAVERINAILNQAEEAHPHAAWSLLCNWIADAMVSSPVGGPEYLRLLNEAVTELYHRKIAIYVIESEMAVKH